MSKTIEEVIEGMVDEQMENGPAAIINLDEQTIDMVEKEIGANVGTKKIGEAIQKFALKRGYDLDYNNKGGNNNFVIKPNGKDA